MRAGSENNSLYLYYKGLSKTLLTFKFDTVKSVLDKDKKEDDTNEFVSAVCWRALPDGVSAPVHCYHTHFDALQTHDCRSQQNLQIVLSMVNLCLFFQESNVLIAANSQGTIKVRHP